MRRLQKIGQVSPVHAKDVKFSRVGLGLEKLDRNMFDPEGAYDQIAALGVKYIRIQSGWMRTEQQKGVYDFAWLDEVVDNLLSRGLTPWINITYGNPIYTPLAANYFGAVGCPPVSTEEERTAWNNYVTTLVAHMKGRVSLFEIWNECDQPYAWRTEENLQDDGMSGISDPKAYGEFAIRTAKAIKAGNPDARIIGIAMGNSKNGMNFLSTVMKTGLGDHIDAVAYHTYTTRPFKRKEVYRLFSTLIHQYAPHVKIIQGESGCQSACSQQGALCKMDWTEERQAKYLIRQMVSDLACDIEFTSYFSAVDMIECHYSSLTQGDNLHKTSLAYYGLLHNSFDENGRGTAPYTPKRSYYAMQTIASLFKEDTVCIDGTVPYQHIPSACRFFNNPDCSDPTYDQHFFKLSDGRTALAYWNHTEILQGDYNGSLSIELMIENAPQLIDLMDGSIYELSEDMIEKTEGTIRLHHIPLRDYPLLLVWDK